ncbi:sensor histidine kinase [Maridesulfovibrio hydrothermalis]|uniref:histidine kinase n=1 Tax=Maridesulfovibrio hydrothermalis AM13 = DSM 14728 TaxID=1121451 RepID=L0RH07_9BACT|nr:HAMP domain-containing sensor histidine kinase [Maridesulfovibrio hydrothermalis]CCO25522.1 Histidine kinase [Maridesulfovibrio hydrothermalis AM13 = DSM 14728]
MPKLNIRQKIIIGIAIFSICFWCIGILSYSNTIQLEREVLLVERVDDLSNIILEIRRTEKNLFLYNDPAIFSQGIKYIDKAETLLLSLMTEFSRPAVREHGVSLKTGLDRYRDLLGKIVLENGPDKTQEQSSTRSLLRESGQNLVEHSRAIASFERKNILNINNNLRTNLLFSIVAIGLVILALVMFVSSNIIRPLRLVQEATKRISLGTFKAIPIKNAHDEIQQVFAALNSMVEQLKKRRQQLVQAQKLSSIGTLASGIAHQLNNPLNNISTSCQILMESEPDRSELADKMMHNIKQETLRSRDIVKGLLEFSREREYSPAPIILDSVVQSAVRLVSSQVPSDISIETNIPEKIILQADRQRLQEAFINLIINAVQAIEPESGTIVISASTHNDNAVITVKDTGTGMSTETLERIFDPFFSTKEVGQGTGLGLYIVYGIVEKHQGKIRAESIPGDSTAFFITLPLAKDKFV